LASSQSGGDPPTQAPAAQVSVVVHASESSHGAVLSVFVHPAAVSHPSSVHPLASSQSGGAPPVQDPSAQVSLVVHASPSSHERTLESL
jgi:hypothetical protein